MGIDQTQNVQEWFRVYGRSNNKADLGMLSENIRSQFYVPKHRTLAKIFY